MRTTALRLLGLAGVAAFVAGCGEQNSLTSPPAVAGSSASRTLLGVPQSVRVVNRTTALPGGQSASAVIGAFGGRLTIASAGLTVIVPPFAVASPTRITVTAVAGKQVAYEFEPHGTRFIIPLLVSQNLSGTDAVTGGLLSSSLKGGYFASLSDLNPVGGTALVSELLGIALNLNTKTATFPVFHFSGYLVATGCENPEEGSGTQQ